MLKAVVFDIDGVLAQVRMADMKQYKRMLHAAGYAVPEDEKIATVVHLPLWEGVKQLLGIDDYDEITRVRDILLEPNATQANLVMYPKNIRAVLEALAKRYRLGIVTGRFKSGVVDFFDAHHVEHLFEQVVTYEDTKAHKPDPEPLLLILQRLDLSPDEVLYVGDMEYDVLAAKNAGMRCVQVSSVPSPDATVHITDIDQLAGAIDAL